MLENEINSRKMTQKKFSSFFYSFSLSISFSILWWDLFHFEGQFKGKKIETMNLFTAQRNIIQTDKDWKEENLILSDDGNWAMKLTHNSRELLEFFSWWKISSRFLPFFLHKKMLLKKWNPSGLFFSSHFIQSLSCFVFTFWIYDRVKNPLILLINFRNFPHNLQRILF